MFALLTSVLSTFICSAPAFQASTVPSWWNSITGVSDSVLPPWTPIRIEEYPAERQVAIGVWGRTYVLGNSPFPSQIEILGQEILAGPITLTARVEGKHTAWKGDGTTQVVEASPVKVELRSSSVEHDVTFQGTTTIEYDGMVRFDFTVIPSRTVRIEKLQLEIPIKSGYASLRTYWPAAPRSTLNSGAVPEGRMYLPFKAFVWLGNEDLGLGWFSESDANWFPRYPRQAIEIRNERSRTTLILHLIDRPMTIGGETGETEGSEVLSYTLGIQATPIKPWPKDFHGWHLDHSVGYGWEETEAGAEKSNLEVASELGVKTLVFHESWTEIQNYSSTRRGEELKRLVSSAHALGMKVLLYFGYEMSTLAPEWDRFSNLVLVRPRAGGYKRLPEQTAYVVCYRSQWANFLVDGIQDVLASYDVDGVYLDSAIMPWACMNTDHGCGYETRDGRIKPTFPVFAVREMMKRIYTVVGARRGGMVNAHAYGCILTPTLAWSTSYWDGEQIATMAPEGKHPLELVSLEAFRAEFMGRNHGVPAEFLVYVPRATLTTRQALALSLIHDVPVRPSGVGTMLQEISKIWSIWNDFAVDDADWYPYWSNQQFVRANSDSIVVSFHRHPDHGLLLVISNLGEGDALAEVNIDLSRFGIDHSAANAFDEERKEPVTFDGSRLKILIPRTDFRLVRIGSR